MFARVARFEGGSAEDINAAMADIAARASTGPPEGVPATGFTLLADAEGGRVIAISLFETEEDMRKGDATLNEMNPPGDGMGKRGQVESYEVAVDVRMPSEVAARVSPS